MSGIADLVAAQRGYFATGATRDLKLRYDTLEQLLRLVEGAEGELNAALRTDLGKPAFEAYATEFGLFTEELRFIKARLYSWSRPRRVRTPLFDFPAKTRIHPEPYGTAAILAPWNYPFLLLAAPTLGALAAGNTAVLKPSEFAPATAAFVEKLINDNFPPELLVVVTGEAQTARELLAQPLDYIFFTGSPAVGKKVMQAAAERLTPLTLELGGKSPAVVDADAELKVCARRLIWGKFINAGQTCIAPDYVLVRAGIKDRLLELLKAQIERFYGAEPRKSADYARIVNDRHLERLIALIDEEKVYCGGEYDRQTRYLAPTILDGVGWGDAVMQEEVFGPLLPVLTFNDLGEALAAINARPRPLALYYFGQDRRHKRRVVEECSFGGGCINETVMHMVTSRAPFGGVGRSGMGAYNGRWSFDTFTHYKTVLEKGTWLDIPLRYPPYDEQKLRWTRRFLG
ncbi:MAG: aldehyde dehydrogenase family protein [Candidatus Coatesbacteria bacterium]|nr:aldehyde dehydrogenase family protein [Candidatus Coatesbacteria bacterium]